MSVRGELELIAGGEHSEVTHASTVAHLLEQNDTLLVRLHRTRFGGYRTTGT